MTVLEASRFRSVVSRPVAEKMPGLRGIRSVGISASRASALACTGPAPPKRDEDELAGVVTALDRDQVERVHHRGVRDLDDPVRRLDEAQAERIGAALLDRPPGALDVEADLTARGSTPG